MPMALPRRRRTDDGRVVQSSAPAGFVVPEAAPKRWCTIDDAAELRGIKQERRAALGRLRRSDERSWRDAP